MIIDFHVHVTKWSYHPWVLDFLREFKRTDGFEIKEINSLTQERIESYLDQEGVDLAVIVPELCPVTIGVLDVEEVSRFCKESKRLIPFASIDPNTVPRPNQELKRLVREIGFKGLKLYPTYQLYYPNDSHVYPVYAAAEELQIPVMVHTGSSVFPGARLKYGNPLWLDEVATDFPNLTIIQVHSGRGFWYQKAFFLSQLHKNVYMEIAGLPPQNLLTYFPELERNADKVVFGTDWPAVPGIKHNIDKLKKLPISREAKEKILGTNAARILKLE
jgi:predicted TIM-barrel fold metal-dependent hydrolase